MLKLKIKPSNHKPVSFTIKHVATLNTTYHFHIFSEGEKKKLSYQVSNLDFSVFTKFLEASVSNTFLRSRRNEKPHLG